MGQKQIMPLDLDEVCNTLKTAVMFKDCDQNILRMLAASLDEVDLVKGEPVFLENELSQFLYFVKTGSVEIVRYYPNLRQIVRIAMIRAGNQFSELSVLTQSNHSSSAFAVESTTLLRLHATKLYETLAQSPLLLRGILVALAQLNSQLASDLHHVEYVKNNAFNYHPQMPQLIPHPMIVRHQVVPVTLHGTMLQVALVNPKNRGFIDEFKLAHPDFRLKITAIAPLDFKRLCTSLKELYRSQNAQSPAPTEGGTLISSGLTHDDLRDAFSMSSFFSKLPMSIIDQLIPYVGIKEYRPGQTVFAANTPSHALYIIYKGAVDLTLPTQKDHANYIARITQGSSFGELSLILQRPHGLDATAIDPTIVLSLDKGIFNQLTGVLEFALPLARLMAYRLQENNSISNIRSYSGNQNPNFESLAKLLPLELMQDQFIVPLALHENEVTIGVVNPEDDVIYYSMNHHLAGYRVRLLVISLVDFERWIKIIDKISAKVDHKSSHDSFRHKLRIVSPDTDVTSLAEELIQLGFNSRASDIHIEPQPNHHIVRYRIDGTLQELCGRLPPQIGERLVNRIKILSAMDITKTRIPQDGQLRSEIAGIDITARVSTVPTKFGENLVMRLIKPQQTVIPLSMLAPDKRTISALMQMTRYKQGMILVSGPTGSGKTTTLYSILSELNRMDKHIITVEDPIEANIPGLTQIEVNPANGLTFATALRHVLRQDPDIIMAGEIRDPESANIAFQAALTGHLVLATIHTNDSIDIAARLRDLEVSASTMSSGIIWSVSQRLLRTLCTKCKMSHMPSTAEKQRFAHALGEMNVPKTIMIARGCDHCHGSGYYERTPVFEYWRNSPAVTSALQVEGSLNELRSAIYQDGFQNLVQFGIKLVANGQTTFEEVDRNLCGLNT